jgi:hypothetical protein
LAGGPSRTRSGQDAKPYAYVGGDPVNRIDPSGLSLCAIKTNNSDDLDSGCVGGSLWKAFKRQGVRIARDALACVAGAYLGYQAGSEIAPEDVPLAVELR